MIILKGNDFGKHLGFILKGLMQNQQTLLSLRLYSAIEQLAISNLVNISVFPLLQPNLKSGLLKEIMDQF